MSGRAIATIDEDANSAARADFQPAHVWEGYSDLNQHFPEAPIKTFNPPMSGRAIATHAEAEPKVQVVLLSTRPCLGGL